MKATSAAVLLLVCLVGLARECSGQTAACNPTACRSTLCSSNIDCQCLSIASNASNGICAAMVLACSSMARCNSDNRTCPVENTVCVNNTRCQYPVCYPLALADKLICPASSATTTTPSTLTTEPSMVSCPLNQIYNVTIRPNDWLNFNTRFNTCPSCVNLTVDSNAEVYGACATQELNITANSNAKITQESSVACPKRVSISATGNADVYNVCATHDLNVFNADGNSMITVQTQRDSICPKYANVSLAGNARVFNICASEMLTVQSATGNNMVTMNYKQLSSCPKVVNIVNGAGNTVFYVCATQAINVKLSGIATLYYKGPLNHTVLSGIASMYPWV